MTKKILSINLWYDMYKTKTDMQLKCFRKLGYRTFIATFCNDINGLSIVIYDSSDLGNKQILNQTVNNYFSAFKSLFSHCIDEHYDFVYIRRLMLKLIYASPFIRKLSRSLPIVYEIPTYPLDKTWDFRLSIRNKIEFFVFSRIKKYLTLIPAVFCDDVPIPDKFLPFLNCIDIENYPVPVSAPDVNDTIRLFISSNLAPSHCINRLFDSMEKYSGKYKLQLTVVSSDTPSYRDAKRYAAQLEITDSIEFLSERSLSDVIKIAKTHHIGVGILTYNEPSRTIDTSLKSKDYCAIGLPFFSSLKDLSFKDDFPYHFILDNSKYEFDIADIIDWYINIQNDTNFRTKMYQYAKENLQYDKYAKNIVNIINAE